MARGCIVVFAALGLAACEHDPIEYIPPTDRALLEAQARLGDAHTGSGAVSVDAMLARARTPPAPSPSAPSGQQALLPLVLQFAASAVAPDEAQKQSLSAFAASAQGKPVMVISRPGKLAGTAALLGQRRALSVARALTPPLTDVQLRFSEDAPPDTVVVSLEGAQPGRTTP